MFREVKPLVVGAVDGVNACIFAYGQTGAGKVTSRTRVGGCGGLCAMTTWCVR